MDAGMGTCVWNRSAPWDAPVRRATQVRRRTASGVFVITSLSLGACIAGTRNMRQHGAIWGTAPLNNVKQAEGGTEHTRFSAATTTRNKRGTRAYCANSEPLAWALAWALNAQVAPCDYRLTLGGPSEIAYGRRTMFAELRCCCQVLESPLFNRRVVRAVLACRACLAAETSVPTTRSGNPSQVMRPQAQAAPEQGLTRSTCAA